MDADATPLTPLPTPPSTPPTTSISTPFFTPSESPTTTPPSPNPDSPGFKKADILNDNSPARNEEKKENEKEGNSKLTINTHPHSIHPPRPDFTLQTQRTSPQFPSSFPKTQNPKPKIKLDPDLIEEECSRGDNVNWRPRTEPVEYLRGWELMEEEGELVVEHE
ncbi:hypothetical protein BDZ45DRAFT_743238 [Acephala macrosclerotiorum]|nr:hypothetical protein BDZ45DRAFT_743238 [Acephala macrosclerotiorum]